MSEVKTNKISSLASNNDITLDPDGTGDVVVASGHKLGVGTTSPARQLEVYDDGTNGQAVLALTAQNTENSRIMFADPDDNNIGILDYNHSDDSMRFVVNNSERMRIDSSGNVVIADGKIEADKASNPALSGVTNRNTILQLQNTDTGYVAGNATAIDFGTSLTSATASIICKNDNAGSGYGGNLIFATSPTSGNSLTQRVVIVNDGSVLVGDSSSLGNGRFQVDATASFVYCQVMRANASNGAFVLFQKDDGSTIGVIDHTASATRYLTSSDYRLKEAVVDMTGAIDRVKALAPKRFNFIADPDDTTVDGFLAHETQTIVPEAVSGTHNEVDENGDAVMQGIDQSKLVPLLVGALKESIAKIETLETEMTALKARVTALEDA